MIRAVKVLRALIPTLFFAVVLVLSPGVVTDSLADQKAKSYIAEINHISYGIFNVNAWKGQVADIVISEIQHMDLKMTASKLKSTIEAQLTAVIDKLNDQIKESNKHSLGGKIKQTLINLVVDIDSIKKGVPKYADAVITEMTKPETQKTVKDMATKQVKHFLAASYTEENMEPVDRVLKITGTDSIQEATQKLNDEIDGRAESLAWRSYGLIAAVALLFAWAGFKKNRTGYTVVVMFLSLIILLGVGVCVPMIDLEAKISELSFVLIGHKVSFENQILYFQSKSVFNVFWLMITHPDFKMKFVGVLLVTFSIVVPTLKMGASILYFFKESVRSNKFIQFLAFKIGKWSMADVMVIAIMMAYIGFNGILEAQFMKMKGAIPKDVTLFTTNGTTLQLGYFIFISYVILALVLSSYVHAAASPASATSKVPQNG